MSRQVKKPKQEIATIDCDLITIETADGEFGFDTANKLEVEAQVETTDATKLIVKGILRAQKKEVSTLTGHKLTLTDNVFNPELVLTLQGGQIYYDDVDPDKIVGYDPPAIGSKDTGETFKVNAYTAQYDASGSIVQYEKTTYPNCTGVPVAFNSEDDAFRAPEYTINSTPATGEKPYSISYVASKPELVDEYSLAKLAVASVAGATTGKTKITVSPSKDEYTNVYYYKTSATAITLPLYGTTLTGYTLWAGTSEITATTGNFIAVVECTASGKALAGGTATVVSKA